MAKDAEGHPQPAPPAHDATGLIINSLPGLFYLFRASDGRMLRWNRNVERVTGRHTEFVARMSALDFIDAEDHPAVEAAIAQALAEGFGACEARVVRADGTRVPHYFTGGTLHWDGERCICGLGIDITARRAAELELQRTRDRLADAVESMSEAFAYYDADDRLQLFNEQYRACHPVSGPVVEIGRSYEEILRYGVEHGEYPEARGREEAWISEHQRARREGSTRALELRVSDDRWMRLQERPTRDGGMVGVRADITAIKQREQRLRESEERYRGLVELSPDGILVIADGRLQFVNAAGLRIIGASDTRELLGKPLAHFVTPEQRTRIEARLQRVFDGETLEPVEYELRRLNGGVIWVETAAVPIHFEDRPAALSIVRDVSRRRHAEARYQALFESARDAIVIADAEADTIVDLNPRAQALFGRAREAFIGTPRQALFADAGEPPQQDPTTSPDPTATPRPVATHVLGADGRRTAVEVSTNLVHAPDGRLLVQDLFRDVTERRRQERQAADRSRVLELIARASDLARILREITGCVERRCAGTRACVLLCRDGRLQRPDGEGVTLEAAALACAPTHPEDDVITLEAIAANGLWDEPPVHPTLYARPVRDRHGTLIGAVISALSGDGPGSAAFAPIRAALDEAAQLAAIAIERHDLADRLAHQAHHDALTGLPNRTLLIDRLEQALARCRRDGSGLAVIMLDLDDFKLVNDSLGHSAGDQLLQVAGHRLQGCMRGGDTVARLGGDEFVLLLPAADAEVTRHVVGKILQVLRTPIVLAGQDVVVTPSVGIGLFPEDGDRWEALLQAADTAMYAAKHAGRNRHRFFSGTMGIAVAEQLQIDAELRSALAEDQMRLIYQPQVTVDGGRIHAVEALVRWQHPERGWLMPADFLAFCKHGDLAAALDGWVLHRACARAAIWAASGHPWRISVNLTVRELDERRFDRLVRRALAESGLPAERLEIEFAPAQLQRNPHTVGERLRRLKKHVPGIRLCLDGFDGSGQTLDLLRGLPLDTVKLTSRLVHDLDTEPGATGALAAALELGRAQGWDVVACGVEHESQHAALQRLGCPLAQGFHACAPLDADALEAYARDIDA